MFVVGLILSISPAAASSIDVKVTGTHTPTLPPFLALDNRVGFQFASLSLGSDDGSDSTIAGSAALIDKVAQHLVHTDKETSVHIDGHVGMSAPPHLALSYSETRASIVAEALEAQGVAKDRISCAAADDSIQSPSCV